jgi:hypothetical protein
MKRYFLFIVALLTFVRISIAQQAQGEAWNKYQAEKKSELAAGVLEALIPVVGHAYAGDAGKGVVPAVVSVGGLVLMVAGAGNLDATVIALGYLGYLGGRVWGIVSAVQTAEDYNVKLKQQLKLSLTPVRGGIGMSVSYNF